MKIIEDVLIEENSLGIKTLDPKEDSYSKFYDNSNDSKNSLLAQGFSYHNVLYKLLNIFTIFLGTRMGLAICILFKS